MNRRRALQLFGASGAALMCSGFDWSWGAKERRASLLVAGATSMLPALDALVKVFAGRNGHIDVVVEGGGSTPGLVAVQRGAIEIAALTRQPTRFEETNGTRAFLIAKDAVAVVANPAVPLTGLPLAAIRKAFQGEVRRWSDLGGPDMPIQLVHRRDETSTEYSAAVEMLFEQRDVPSSAIRATSDEDMLKIIRREEGAIGYVAISDLPDDLNVLEIGGVAPTRFTVLSGRYPLTRPYYFVTYGPLAPAVVDFLTFVRGSEGQSILEREGLIRVY